MVSCGPSQVISVLHTPTRGLPDRHRQDPWRSRASVYLVTGLGRGIQDRWLSRHSRQRARTTCTVAWDYGAMQPPWRSSRIALEQCTRGLSRTCDACGAFASRCPKGSHVLCTMYSVVAGQYASEQHVEMCNHPPCTISISRTLSASAVTPWSLGMLTTCHGQGMHCSSVFPDCVTWKWRRQIVGEGHANDHSHVWMIGVP